MKKLTCVSFCLSVVLLCSWHPLQHGHCSEQDKPRPHNKTTPDTSEQRTGPGEHRREDETVPSAPPALVTSEHRSQTVTGLVEEQQTPETGRREKSEKQVESITAKVEMTAEVPEPEPDQAVTQSSVHQEQDPEPLPPAVPGGASQSSRVSDTQSSGDIALSGLAPCGAADDSCPSASITAVPSAAACEEGEGPPYDTILASGLPMVLEKASTPGPGKGKKGSLDRVSQGANTSSRLEEEDLHATKESDPSVTSKDPEDIPTFDEWKKIMMEVENEKSQTHTSCNGGSSTVKKVQKTTNYASVECGAKILSSNPEAKSTSAILMENMDMYMLNPCSNKIWFVIELCQPIQVKQLDIANFELFSSTPKDFLVSISDRYPTSKWAKLGTFHARDERTVQSFPLDEHLYAKYVKVELMSHFGSEHFCPLSLVRVFGTSMMEEYELNSELSERPHFQDEDYDDPPRYAHSDDRASKNLIGSAKDAILNMVNNIASNVLGGNPEDGSGGNLSSADLNATEASGPRTAPSTSSDIMLETLSVDQLNLNKITETPPIPEDGGGGQVVAAPTASVSQTPSAGLPASWSRVPESPGQEQIVTLLPKEEGEEPESTGQSEQPPRAVTQQGERRVDAEESASCRELTPHPCSCVLSLREHLLRKCFPLPLFKRRKAIRRTEELSPPQSSTYVQETHTPLQVVASSSKTQVLHTWTVEASSLPEASNARVVVPHFPELEGKLEAGCLDLSPSLTSTLLDPASTDMLASIATQAMNLHDPSPDELSGPQLYLSEQSRESPREVRKTSALTPNLESLSAPVLPTKTDKTARNQKPQTTPEKPSAETDALKASVMSTTAEQAVLPPTPSPSSQSPTHPATAKTAAATGPFTPTPVSAPMDGTAIGSEPRGDELLEDMALGGHAGNGQPGQPSPTEFYAEMLTTTDAPVPGSSQKESVFMRLNNRIKALEVNMSLSGRYLEQLSQRYRKQMEEMQKAFNKTIIKLQDTARMAEDQDQKQTESIQVLQGQLENVTHLLLNLSMRVSQLQSEVSDRHSYLLLCFVLCLLLGLVVCTNVCCVSAGSPVTEHDVPLPDTYSYCSSERASPGYEGVGPKRRASYPLTQSSLQMVPTEGPNEAYNVETQRNLTGNSKKRRSKTKSTVRPETITPTLLPVPNGGLPRNGCPPHGSDLKPPSSCVPRSSPFSLGDAPSEGSSEASSHSDEPSFCGIAPCSRLCEGLPPPMSRSERRSYKRRRSKTGGTVAERLLQPVQCNGPPVGSGPSLHGFTRGNAEWSTSRGGGSDLSRLS